MTPVYVFAVIVALLFVTGLLAAPLLEEEPADPDAADGGGRPEARKEAALDALRELEFEYETDKLSEEDYRRLKDRYARAAVEARDEAEGERDRCPECDARAEAGARFCSRCGAELAP